MILWSRYITLNLFKAIVKCLLGAILCIYLLHPSRYSAQYNFITQEEFNKSLLRVEFNDDINFCDISTINQKPFDINKLLCDIKYDQSNFAAIRNISIGGWWSPDDCQPVIEVAIVVPYRQREEQLSTFLRYMHPFLQNQRLSYRIFIVEQSPEKPFNRGILMNIGFKEAQKLKFFPCFIFHDVDLIPETAENIYGCCNQHPRHLSCSINVWRYNLMYDGAFGGVIAISAKQFELINGFSNEYFGWGAEDDDLLKRILLKGLSIVRLPPILSRYYMLPHKAEEKSPDRLAKLQTAETRFQRDGLNSLSYEVLSYSTEFLFTRILVKV